MALADTSCDMAIGKICSLRLVQGTSKSRGFTLSSSCRRAVFRVGSALECNWRVFGAGVAEHHFMLMWNGSRLSVVDVGAANLFVNGKSIQLSRELLLGRIDFGSAAVVVDQCPESRLSGTLRAIRHAIPHEGAHDGATEPRQ